MIWFYLRGFLNLFKKHYFKLDAYWEMDKDVLTLIDDSVNCLA